MYVIRVIPGNMENSKALLNFDVLGWLTVIIQIKKLEYYVNNLPYESKFLLRIVHTRYKNMYSYFI